MQLVEAKRLIITLQPVLKCAGQPTLRRPGNLPMAALGDHWRVVRGGLASAIGLPGLKRGDGTMLAERVTAFVVPAGSETA